MRLIKRGAKIQKKEDDRLLFLDKNAIIGQLLFSAETFVRNGQFFSAFRSAGGQYTATVGGGHSLSETVFVSASFI